MPHMVGKFDNLHYALGCNGSGIAMMTYLGQQTARKVAGKANRVCAFDCREFPDHPLYNGSTWFMRLRLRCYVPIGANARAAFREYAGA